MHISHYARRRRGVGPFPFTVGMMWGMSDELIRWIVNSRWVYDFVHNACRQATVDRLFQQAGVDGRAGGLKDSPSVSASWRAKGAGGEYNAVASR